MNHDRRGRPAAKALIRGRDTVIGGAPQGWRTADADPNEIVLQFPEDLVVDGMAVLESAMTMELFGVPITATSVPLIDEAGVSHWMTSERAAVCAEMRKTAMAA